MPTKSLGLERLQPEGRSTTARTLFSHDEWEQIEAARERGVSWKQIQDHTDRYKTANTLNSSFRAWKKRNGR